jgi:hypothetical protein
MFTQFWLENVKQRYHLEGLDLNEKMLETNKGRWHEMDRCGSGLGLAAGSFKHCNKLSRHFHNMQEISCLAEQLSRRTLSRGVCNTQRMSQLCGSSVKGVVSKGDQEKLLRTEGSQEDPFP